jgi:glycosidase
LELAHTQYRDADWYNRDFALSNQAAFDALLDIWKFWMVYSGCDGFRVDTFKHFPPRRAAQLTQTLRQFAADRLGMDDFLVLGEIGGTDDDAASYLEYAEDEHLRVLGIGGRRQSLRRIAGGAEDAPSADEVLEPVVGDVHVELVRDRVMMTIDDHDGLGLDPACRLAGSYSPNAVVGAAALLLFGPGIPCLYYGTEQALAGPVGSDAALWLDAEPSQNHPSRWGVRTRGHNGDRYLREAMFGPVHPRRAGEAGMGSGADAFDDLLPGFGPNGTSGYHVFNENSPWFRALAKLIALRKNHEVLWAGAIHTCPLRVVGDSEFSVSAGAGVVAWTRSADGQRALIVLNNGRLGAASGECQVALPEGFAVNSALSLAAAVSAAEAAQLPPQTVLQVGSVDSAERAVNVGGIAPFSVQVYLG